MQISEFQSHIENVYGKKIAGIELEAPLVQNIREIPDGGIGMLQGPELKMDGVRVGEASETCGRYALDSFRRASALCKSGELAGFRGFLEDEEPWGGH